MHYSIKVSKKEGEKEVVKVVEVVFPYEKVVESIKATETFEQVPQLELSQNKEAHQKFEENVELKFYEKDCLEVAVNAKEKGLKPVVLVFGSEKFPLEGFKGNEGQEEDIYRRTSISLNLSPNNHLLFTQEKWSYQIKGGGGIHCKDVILFRGTSTTGYNYCPPRFLDFIVSASPPRSKLKDKEEKGRFFVEVKDEERYENKLRSALSFACKKGYDCFVLGAFGCGHSKVPATQAVKVMVKLISTEFAHAFKEIRLAVIDDANSALDHNKVSLTFS